MPICTAVYGSICQSESESLKQGLTKIIADIAVRKHHSGTRKGGEIKVFPKRTPLKLRDESYPHAERISYGVR